MSTLDGILSPPSDFDGEAEALFNKHIRTITNLQLIFIISSVVILVIIVAVTFYCRKRIRKAVVSDIKEIKQAIAPDAVQTPPLSHHAIQVWDSDAPTMERFFQELAREKPVRFSAQQLATFTSNYSKVLGSGGYGKVYKGSFPNGVNIAVKVLKRRSFNGSANRNIEEQFMAEVGTIGRTHHINLVRLYGFCYDQHMSALVYEFMENGSLDRHLFSDVQQLEWEKLHEIAVGTAKGIAYLPEECQQRIIHYDIKPENILLDANFSPKVADFGLSKLCNRDDTHVTITGCRGTPGYLAPEFMLKNYPITYKCDVYSFGVLLFEVVGRRRNTKVNSSDGNDSLDWFPKQVWEEYEKGKLMELTEACGIEEKDRSKAERMAMVALWCVQDSPGSRPPMSGVVKMLEGGVEIMTPPKPFQFWFSAGNVMDQRPSNSTTSTTVTNSYWYKEAANTPIMAKYEIQLATL